MQSSIDGAYLFIACCIGSWRHIGCRRNSIILLCTFSSGEVGVFFAALSALETPLLGRYLSHC